MWTLVAIITFGTITTMEIPTASYAACRDAHQAFIDGTQWERKNAWTGVALFCVKSS